MKVKQIIYKYILKKKLYGLIVINILSKLLLFVRNILICINLLIEILCIYFKLIKLLFDLIFYF